MGWLGMLIGSYVGGSALRGGPLLQLLGAIAGAVLGSKVEDSVRGRRRPLRSADAARNQSMVFCGSVAAMLAKMAKADGVVTREEIASVEKAFRRLGFTPAARRYAIDVFRRAKDDAHSIYDYARDFAEAVDSVEVRELFYEILWDIACADGRLGAEEAQILQRIPRALGIRTEWYGYFYSQRISGARYGAGSSASSRDPLADAYAVLGASSGDDVETLKRKYRELAKKNHPDALRAQGLPEEMVGKATERMSRINAAWAAIREARGI